MTDQERNEFVASIIRWATKYAFRLQPKLCRTIGFDEVESDLWELFLSVADQYDPERGKPSTWASWRVRGYLSGRIRKIHQVSNIWSRTTPLSDTYLADQFELSDSLVSWGLSDSLREAVGKLPEPQRAAIVGLLDGLTLQQIADSENVTKEAIRLRILTAVRNLRAMFGLSPLLCSGV